MRLLQIYAIEFANCPEREALLAHRLFVEELQWRSLRLDSPPCCGMAIRVAVALVGPKRMEENVLRALFIAREITQNGSRYLAVLTRFGGS